jgi:ammonium transporter, Amt family
VWKIDDPTAALAIHGVGGAWALIAAGLFGSARAPIARLKFLGIQLLGIVAIAVLVIAVMALLFFLIKQVAVLRSREADEFDGLDLAEHDIGSYPDFQQTMIKSYHLREA